MEFCQVNALALWDLELPEYQKKTDDTSGNQASSV